MEFTDLKVGMKIVLIGAYSDLLSGEKLTIGLLDKSDRSINVTNEYGNCHWFWFIDYGEAWEVKGMTVCKSDDELKHIQPIDYQSLIDIALMTNDKEWFNEICAIINGSKVGELNA